MIFNWSSFDENDWVSYCARMENNGEYPHDFIGCVYAGDLVFDVVVRVVDGDPCMYKAIGPDDDCVLSFTCFVGGVDDGFGYSRLEKDYPYDEAGGGDFCDTCISLGYDDFQAYAEREFSRWINENKNFYDKADLEMKANMPHHVW